MPHRGASALRSPGAVLANELYPKGSCVPFNMMWSAGAAPTRAWELGMCLQCVYSVSVYVCLKKVVLFSGKGVVLCDIDFPLVVPGMSGEQPQRRCLWANEKSCACIDPCSTTYGDTF